MTRATMAGLLTTLVLIFLMIDLITIVLARMVDPRLRMDMLTEAAGSVK
jgi:hypothetical protein